MKTELIAMLLEILESVCTIIGKLVASLALSVPMAKKYLVAFIRGAENLVKVAFGEQIIHEAL
jgi:hypothetical protein